MAARVLLLGILLTDVIGLASVAGAKGVTSLNASKTENFQLDTEPRGTLVVGRKGGSLKCSVKSNQRVFWLCNGVPVPPCSPVQCNTNSRNSTLHFIRMTPKYYNQEVNKTNETTLRPDEYRCVVESAAGSVRSSPAFLQLAELAREFKESPQNLTVYEGEVARLSCLIDSVPFPPNITWKHEDRVLWPGGNAKYFMVSPGVLYISATKLSDAGSYKCEATNGFSKKGLRKSKEATLRVVPMAEPLKSHVPVSLYPQLSYNYRLTVGSNVDLACAASGFPSRIIWKFISRFQNGTHDQPRLLFNSTNGLRVLGLRNVDVHDAGNYSCSTDDPEIAPQVIVVDVLVPPKFLKKPAGMVSPNGKTARFECQVKGIPAPDIYWLKDARNITTKRRHTTYVIHGVSQLAISATVPTDAGLYQCVASNPAGEIWAAGRLRVNTTSGGPPAPTSVECAALSPNIIVVSWKSRQSAAFSSPNAYFTVHYAISDGDAREDVALAEQGNHTSVNITGLEPFTNYSIYVRMYNDFGASNQSDTIQCATGESVPTTAPNISVETLSNTKLKISWTPLTKKEARGIVVEYKLQWRIKDHPSSRVINFPSNVTSYTFTDLVPGIQCQIRVLARTQIGYPNTSDVQFNWIPVKIPESNAGKSTLAQLVHLNVIHVNSSTIKVKWIMRDKNAENLRKFDSWRMYCQFWDGKNTSSDYLPKNSTEHLFFNLETNSSYVIVLCIVKSNETLECFSKPIDNTQPDRTFGINGLEARPVSSTSINVRWSAPPPSNEYHYEICYEAVQFSGIGRTKCFETYNVTFNVTISKLRPYTMYEIKMRIIDKTGKQSGAYSETIECYTKEDVPGIVQDLQCYPGTSKITMTWTKPNNFNGILRNYSISYADESNPDWTRLTLPASQTFVVLAELVPDKHYCVRVSAASNAGYGEFVSTVVDLGCTEITTKCGVFPTNPSPKSDDNLGVILGVSISIFCMAICLSSIYCRKWCVNTSARNDRDQTRKNQILVRNGNGCCPERDSPSISQHLSIVTVTNDIELSVRSPAPSRTSNIQVDAKGDICPNGVIEPCVREPLLSSWEISSEVNGDRNLVEESESGRNSDCYDDGCEYKLDDTKLTTMNCTLASSSNGSLNNNVQRSGSQSSQRPVTSENPVVDPNR